MPDTAGRMAGRLLTGLLATFLGAMLLLAAAQILWRNVFRMSIPYSEQLLEWLVLWIAMLGAMAASVGSRHITIDALSQVLSKPARRWAGVTAQFFALVACLALFLICGSYWLDTMSYGETTLGGLPRWAFEAILPVAFAVMAGAHLAHMVSLLRHGRLAGGAETAGPPTAD
ncbi:MAG: TRAP transporter small permease [Gammaproteobacteria bacterium]|nr:TRAP transporter small permease [Gammaproteobacteria bacterium]MYF66858.1 TRAP transporter small permease [Gammaproteobacteria bacterium]MYK36290.1 TRAP transporter small permease [Gammaproteobacteria bacterium]